MQMSIRVGNENMEHMELTYLEAVIIGDGSYQIYVHVLCRPI